MIKKLFLLSMIVATSFCATAKQFDFLASGMMNTDGTVLDGGKVYFYVNDGGSTPKNVYLDYLEATVATQPIRLDDSGMPYDYPSGTTPIAIYGDGTYRVVVKDSNDVTLYTWTGINSQAQVDFGGLYVDIATRYGTNTTAMQNAIAAYPTANATFLFNSSTFTATSALNFPSNITMKFANGGNINIANGIAITVNKIEAVSYQIFTGTGVVNIVTANNSVIDGKWKNISGVTVATMNINIANITTLTLTSINSTIVNATTLNLVATEIGVSANMSIMRWDTMSGTMADSLVVVATTDCIVTAYLSGNGAIELTLYSDSSNPPTTVRSNNSIPNVSGAADVVTVFSPVKKGDFFKVSNNAPGTYPNNQVHIMRLGK